MSVLPHPKKSIAVLVVGLLAVIPVNVLAASVNEAEPESASGRLLETPTQDGVWLLGNSIFKTGVDPEQLESALGVPVAFEYHGGHYTSLWYLIARNALPDLDEQPGVVVWGFRPAYAALPGFRQNVVNDTEGFVVDSDAVYERLAQGIDAPRRGLDSIASGLDGEIAGVALFELRERAAAKLASTSLELGTSLAERLGASGGDLVRREVIDGDSALLDVLNDAVTGGKVQLAEERVIDGVGDFIIGDTAEYADSFVPVIAAEIDRLGMDQLVIIWPPRAVVEGTPSAQDDEFVESATAALRDAGIPILDLYNEADIVLDFYASGDHFNPEGREDVTKRVADALRELGYG